MAQSVLTPLEQSVCAWLVTLPGTWTELRWEQYSATEQAGFARAVKAGFVEAKISVVWQARDGGPSLLTRWDVCGDYEPLMRSKVHEYAAAHGHGDDLELRLLLVRFARLTPEGELAKRDLEGGYPTPVGDLPRAGVPEHILRMITGGPAGEGGVSDRGRVQFLGELRNPAEMDRPATQAGAAVAGPSINQPPAGQTSGSSSPTAASATTVPPVPPEAPAKTGIKAEHDDRRSMTQDEVDQAIAKYKAERAAKYNELRDAIQHGSRQARRAARRLFGRDALAKAINCRSKTQVSASSVYHLIRTDLNLGRSRRDYRKRVGLSIAAETAAQAVGDPTVAQAIDRETKALAREHLPARAAAELIAKLESGQITSDMAAQTVELYRQQVKDDRSRHRADRDQSVTNP